MHGLPPRWVLLWWQSLKNVGLMYSYSAGWQGIKTSASEGQLEIRNTYLNVCDCTWDFPAGRIFGPFCLNVVHCQFLEVFGRILCSERNEENPSLSKFWLWLHQLKIWILLWLAWLSFGSCPNPSHTLFLCFSHFILMYMISLYSCSLTYIKTYPVQVLWYKTIPQQTGRQ